MLRSIILYCDNWNNDIIPAVPSLLWYSIIDTAGCNRIIDTAGCNRNGIKSRNLCSMLHSNKSWNWYTAVVHVIVRANYSIYVRYQVTNLLICCSMCCWSAELTAGLQSKIWFINCKTTISNKQRKTINKSSTNSMDTYKYLLSQMKPCDRMVL